MHGGVVQAICSFGSGKGGAVVLLFAASEEVDSGAVVSLLA